MWPRFVDFDGSLFVDSRRSLGSGAQGSADGPFPLSLCNKLWSDRLFLELN